MDKPIFDPPIPYIGPIQTRFIPGKIIKIQGTVPAVAYRFNVNLQCGSQTTPQDDIAIQIAVKILDGYIALNSLENSIWDEEQRNLTLQIKRAEKFEIILKCEFSQYKVTINGTHYEFPQRIHYDRISHLVIDGDVSIIQISYEPDSLSDASGYSVDEPNAPPIVDKLQNCQSINATLTTGASPLGTHSSPFAGFADPPPYDVFSNNTEQHPPQYNKPPYPTQPSNPPYPSQFNNPQYPTNTPYPRMYTPYPTNVATGVPYLTNTYPPPGAPGAVTYVYPTPGAPGIPVPPPGAPVPLNAASSNFRPVKRNRLRRTCAIFWSVLLIIIGIIAIIIIKVLRKGVIHKNHSHSSSSYSSSSDRW